MDIENELFIEYKNYILNNSIFKDYINIYPKTPKSKVSFPIIVFKETNNIDYIDLKSIDNSEYSNQLFYSVDIYTQDITIEDNKYYSTTVMSEIKNLTFDFFRIYGFTRTSSVPGETVDYSINRNVSIFSGIINNWNRKII